MISYLSILLISLMCGTASASQPEAIVGDVLDIRIEGLQRIEEGVVLSAIGMRGQDVITSVKIRRDLKSVYDTGFFDDVEVIAEEGDGGYTLVFVVVEKPRLREVLLEGNKKIKEDDIREVLDAGSSRVLNDATIKRNEQLIRDVYLEKGFYLVEVIPEVIPVEAGTVDLLYTIRENRKVIVQQIEIYGNDSIPVGKIKRFLQIKEGGFAPWLTSTGQFQEDLLEIDAQTIGALYLEEGFVDVKVDPPNVYLSPDKRQIFISYHINEGDKYNIGELTATGDFIDDLGLTEDVVMGVIGGRSVSDIQESQWRYHEGKAPRKLKVETKGPRIVAGEPFRYSAIHQVMTAIATLYEDKGFAFVNVVPLTLPNPESKSVDISFEITTGDQVRIGRIGIVGNDPTLDKVIRREIMINEGDLYRGSLIEASRARLLRLGFFEDVSISTPRGEGENVLDLNVDVTEQPTGSFSLGMGYSNLESFVLTANVSKNNFLGLGYVMAASVNWSKLRKQGNLSFMDPYFLDSRWSLKFDAYSINREFQLNEYQRGGDIGIGRYLDPMDDVQLRLEYTIEDVGLTSLDPFRKKILGGELYRNGLTSSLGVSLSIDKRNNRIFPTQGFFLSAGVTLAGGFRIDDERVLSLLGGEFNFLESRLNFRFFQPIIPNSDMLIFRFNSTLGHILSTDGRAIPYIHRFRAGGINSVRGYNWFSLGPAIRSLSADDPARADDRLIVGGTETWINNFEIESPIVKQAGISAVVFFDAGNAFGDPWGEGHINPLELRLAYGFGIRWRSPIGPLRFEWGFPIQPREDERSSVFDFSIGSFF